MTDPKLPKQAFIEFFDDELIDDDAFLDLDDDYDYEDEIEWEEDLPNDDEAWIA